MNSTVSVMLLVRGGKEGNPEAHVSALKKKSMLNRSGLRSPWRRATECLLSPD